MCFKNLEFPRESINQTKLGNFLEGMYLKYNSLVRNKSNKFAEIKLKEVTKIWKKTFVEGQDTKRIKKRQEVVSGLPVSTFIDENVLIGKGVIEAIFQKIHPGYFIVGPKVYPIFRTYFHKDDKIVITDSITGDSLRRVISSVRETNLPFLVGVGGGRVMDHLKYIMMKTGKFCVAIPTSLATHVYASPKIHILPAIAELGEEKTIDGPIPDIVAIDIYFLEKLQENNPRLIRAGLGDLMACITAVPDWKLAEQHRTAKINHAIIDMTNVITETLEKIDVEKPLSEWIIDYSFIQVLLCRVSGWVGSAPVSGSEHLFALAAEHCSDEPPLHGELVALGTLIMVYIQGGDYQQVCQLMKKLKLPTSLSEIGLSVEQTVDALCRAKEVGLKKGRFTIVNTLKMDSRYCGTVVHDLLDKGVIQE